MHDDVRYDVSGVPKGIIRSFSFLGRVKYSK